MRMPMPAAGVTSLVLRDDAHSFDNTRFVVSPEPESLSLLHFGTVVRILAKACCITCNVYR